MTNKDLLNKLIASSASSETKLDSVCGKTDRIEKALYGDGNNGLVIRHARLAQSWKIFSTVLYIAIPVIFGICGTLVIKIFFIGG